MNIFPPLNERHQEYKTYFSNFKSAGRQISGDVQKTVYSDWMRNVVSKFPYFQHTNPRTMVIAAYLDSMGTVSFPIARAREFVAILFPNVRDTTTLNMLIIGVREYYERLRGSR